jgi:hypothetical protein
MATFTRNNAWNQNGTFNNPDLLWYAKGVGVMQSRVDIPEPLITIFWNSQRRVLQHFDHINSLINNCHSLKR